MLSPLLPFQQINPNIAPPAETWKMAQLCLKLGRINQSLDMAYRAVQQDPTFQQRYNQHYLEAIQLGAEFAEEIEDHQKAAYYWNLLVQQIPKNAKAWYGLGIAKANLQDYRGAETALNRALQLEPGNLKMRNNLIQIQQLLKG